MPDQTSVAPKIPIPNWAWGVVLLTGTGAAGAGGAFLGGEPAATKAELSVVEDRVDAMDDKIDDRLDDIESAVERLAFTLGHAPPEAP